MSLTLKLHSLTHVCAETDGARMMQASTNGITYLRRSNDSLTFAPAVLAFSAARRSLISFNSISAWA